MSNSNSRQQWYDRIRASSKDAVILAEMKRLGFWQDTDVPTLSETIIQRRSELQSELSRLYRQKNLYQHPEQALKAMRKQRMQKAREQRALTQRKQAELRLQRARNWYEQHQNGMVWLGEGVSAGLQDLSSDIERLQAHDLPVLHSPKMLAEAMGITLNELRFLAYQRKTSRINHYQRFQIVKKTGGLRDIAAPMPRLKRVQYWLLDNILHKLALHNAAHGFVPGRSIISNAQPHTAKALVINLDLENFFPSIRYARVKGLFKSLGYSESLATVLGLLCTEAAVDEIILDGETWFVMRGERHLPQGAPTSPMISNLLARSLDRRLQGIATKYGYAYTRYADDLSFSCEKPYTANVTRLLWAVRQTVQEEGFKLHPDKTRLMHQGRRQEVTGLVVNQHLSLERKTLRRFRALLQQIEHTGWQGKHWNGVTDPIRLQQFVWGYAHFVAMVLPDKGAQFKAQLNRIQHIHFGGVVNKKYQSAQNSKAQFRVLSAKAQAPLVSWKQAQARPLVLLETIQQPLAQTQHEPVEQAASGIIEQQSAVTEVKQAPLAGLVAWLRSLLR